ncbi:MAG: rhodanese-like domain-containing protein [Chitinophagaceae bacterium]|nr:rhodanese-like domain-containing protein [Chitinophagaceae bacterium]MCW5927047.1 rhodanese-like domain-containing protein [Chitinophagaceae bacterium]
MQYFTIRQLKDQLAENDDIVLLDTRSRNEFTDGFIPGSLFIGHDGKMTDWAAVLLLPETKIILVTPPGKEAEIAGMLRDKGFSQILGVLDGGFEHWKNEGEPVDMIINVNADELAMDIPFDKNLLVLDVRKPMEFADGHIKDSVNLPLNEMKDPLRIAELEDNQNIYIHCASGYRSVIASSVLKQHGFNNIRNVTGGWDAISHTRGFETEKEKSALN